MKVSKSPKFRERITRTTSTQKPILKEDLSKRAGVFEWKTEFEKKQETKLKLSEIRNKLGLQDESKKLSHIKGRLSRAEVKEFFRNRYRILHIFERLNELGLRAVWVQMEKYVYENIQDIENDLVDSHNDDIPKAQNDIILSNNYEDLLYGFLNQNLMDLKEVAENIETVV